MYKRQVKKATDASAYDLSADYENLILYTCYPFDELMDDMGVEAVSVSYTHLTPYHGQIPNWSAQEYGRQAYFCHGQYEQLC